MKNLETMANLALKWCQQDPLCGAKLCRILFQRRAIYGTQLAIVNDREILIGQHGG